MRSLLLHPTSTAQWHALIHEAQKSLSIRLRENLESYLVFLLMRYLVKPEVAQSILGLEFLQSVQNLSSGQPDQLKDVGDKCLLFAGLFPEQALKRRVDELYFIKLGQTAYATLSLHAHSKHGDLYQNLCQEFILLADILQATREVNPSACNLLQQVERWQTCGSLLSWKKITEHTNGLPKRNPPTDKDKSVH